MRVVAGSARGRRLVAPEGRATTRPTSDRVRESVFNVLFSLGGVEDTVVWDLFAGSGALGIEALSRGARRAVFVERDRHAVAAIDRNLAATGLADRAEVVRGDVHRFLPRPGGDVTAAPGADASRADLVFVDPPYALDTWTQLLGVVAAAAGPEALVVVESDREVPVPPPLEKLRVKTYGGTVITFARGATASPETQE